MRRRGIVIEALIGTALIACAGCATAATGSTDHASQAATHPTQSAAHPTQPATRPTQSATHPSSASPTNSLLNKPTQPPPAGRATPWWIWESGPGARSLVIEEHASALGCPAGKGHVILQETKSATRLHVNQRYSTGNCFQMGVLYRYTVHLKAPIAGRPIEGSGLIWSSRGAYITKTVPDPPLPDVQVPQVPRVLGFAPDQAVKVLATQYFHGVVAGTGREVVAQSPGRGGVPADSRATKSAFAGTVTLTAGR